MNELDDLRDALRAGVRHDPVDVAGIMNAGRRLRRRRRLVATTAAAAVFAVTGMVVTLVRSPIPDPADLPAASATVPSSPTQTSAPAPSRPTPSTELLLPERRALGDVINTGIQYVGGEERVLWFTALDKLRPAHIPFGLMSGRRSADGTLVSDLMANETERPATAPGFHAISYDSSDDQPGIPTFGYFAGPVDRIVGVVGKRAVTARIERWSKNEKIAAFWFPPDELKPGTPLDGITAYDAQGKPL